MNYLQKYFYPMQNCEEALVKFCELLNVKVTSTSLKKDILEHPDYPSMLAISDVLNNYHIENLALKIGFEQLLEIPTPCIIQVKGEITPYPSFGIIENINNADKEIEWYNPEHHKTEKISYASLSKRFNGYVLAAEKDEHSIENNFAFKLKEQKRKSLINNLLIIAIPLLTFAISIVSIFYNGTTALLPVAYTIITLSGALVSTLLILYEMDQYNPALQQICHAGKKTNCGAILGTKASKIFGISWAAIGFTYFTGVLFSLLSTGIVNNNILFIASWLNVFCLFYVPYSIVYQWKIAKQWCPLCLTVQGLLVLQFIVALAGGFHSMSLLGAVTVNSILLFLLFFALVFIAIQILIPALEKAKENKDNRLGLQRLKHNPQIFEALLSKQRRITQSTDGLGITIGNPKAKYTLIKVCNPYCGPCAKAHPVIEDLLKNNDNVKVQIIFMSTDSEDDYRSKPVRHLMAIYEINKKISLKALDEWYLADKKDYDIFATKFPMNGELELQTDKIKDMFKWCNETKIVFTPTFFINGYQLPDMYSVADLKYFLSV